MESREELRGRIDDHTAVIGVVGLGYVGLPLAVETARAGYRTLGFDVSERAGRDMRHGGSSRRGDCPEWACTGPRLAVT